MYIGPHEIGNVNAMYAKAARECGIETTSTINTEHTIRRGNVQYDKCLHLERHGKIARYVIASMHLIRNLRHDAYIFIYNESIMPRNADLPILKILNKKIIMVFVGCDIRTPTKDPRCLLAKCPYIEKCLSPAKKKHTKKLEGFATATLAQPRYAHVLTRPYGIFWPPIDPKEIEFKIPKNNPPAITHAATMSQIKGTKHIISATDNLSKSYDLRFTYFNGKAPRSHVRRTLTNTDISIDQLLSTGHGIYAIESMAAGCAVIGSAGRYEAKVLQRTPDLPMIPATPETVEERIKDLLEHPEKIPGYARAGGIYVEKYHEYRKVFDDIMGMLR